MSVIRGVAPPLVFESHVRAVRRGNTFRNSGSPMVKQRYNPVELVDYVPWSVAKRTPVRGPGTDREGVEQ